MFVSMRAKKNSWDKTAIFLSVWRQKKNQPKNEIKHIYFKHYRTESTTWSKNQSLDRMTMSD